MQNLTSLDKFVLESIRNVLRSKGYKFSYSQILSEIKKISNINTKVNQTQHSLNYLWTMYNTDPPRPPYRYYFESQHEAMLFAKRAKKKHNVNCDIDLVSLRRWRLTTKKKRKEKIA